MCIFVNCCSLRYDSKITDIKKNQDYTIITGCNFLCCQMCVDLYSYDHDNLEGFGTCNIVGVCLKISMI